MQTAILHYINGGLPALAAQSIIRHRWGARLSSDVLETLLTKLGSSAQQDAAGELLEHLQRYDEALESFRACAPTFHVAYQCYEFTIILFQSLSP